MNTEKKAARIVGTLFIVAIVMLFIGEAFYSPFLNSSDYLETAYPNRTIVIIGILLEFVCIPAIVLIPVFLFPVLRKHNEVLALGYVCFRLLEAVIFSIAEVNKLVLMRVSQDYLISNSVDASYFQNIGSMIKSVIYWTNSSGLIYLIFFIIGAFILYSVLYKSKLIPRFISVWGLFSAVALLTGSMLSVFVDISPVMAVPFYAPIALNELTLAVWLIVKGFDESAIASRTV